MPRQLLKDTCEVAAQIMDGQHDADLDFIAQACAARQKNRFQVGTRVRLVGTRNPEYEGKEGVIFKRLPKRFGVGFGEKSDLGFYAEELNVPPSMLEVI